MFWGRSQGVLFQKVLKGGRGWTECAELSTLMSGCLAQGGQALTLWSRRTWPTGWVASVAYAYGLAKLSASISALIIIISQVDRGRNELYFHSELDVYGLAII
jgi:hypothetical protein